MLREQTCDSGTHNLIAMSELRYDALSGRRVIVTSGRSDRPNTFPRSETAAGSATASCPFCPGHESMTPPEVARTGSGTAGEAGWQTRVFPNLYPIVGGPNATEGTIGAHEVVVLSPDHGRSFGQLDDTAAATVFGVLHDRVRAHLHAARPFACAFVNHGRGAGASIAHPHGQVVALDFVPPDVEADVERFGSTPADLVIHDAADGAVILERAPVVAWAPWASTSPYFVRVAHTQAGARFDLAADDELAAVAVALRDVLARLGAELSDPPYNVLVRSAPPGSARFHWYVEVTPRVSLVAGFEQLTGLFVNVVPPEDAARVLRGDVP
jgi:UDPglucose--hexose-1-phosphate uridylyltransferase